MCLCTPCHVLSVDHPHVKSALSVVLATIMEELFKAFLTKRFPLHAKRETGGVIRAALGEITIRVLKDPTAGKKNLRFIQKTSVSAARST